MPVADLFIHDSYFQVSPSGYALATSCLILICIGLLTVAYRRIADTTLVGPWWWSIAALVSLASVEIWLTLTAQDIATAAAWRFAMGVGAFCPLMSLLGAKRPQDRGWHFIVASLWGMLALPAIETLILRPGQPLAIIDLRAWFLIGLIGLNLLVLLPTRRWLPSMLVSLGQFCLLWPYLPWVVAETSAAYATGASLCYLLAISVVALQRHRAMELPLDSLWLDFRDAFGALWAARVLERMNAAAVMYDWPVRLGWNGFHRADNSTSAVDISPELAAEMQITLVNLLRRFVSTAWIDARLGSSAPTETLRA
ncbi:MAG TPA: hypothetical protein VL096_09260 [Pirellulaceae bacterium]|nr:hypothetical protein [Pirellulaceae bacterium]